jgi:hypothetical protein
MNFHHCYGYYFHYCCFLRCSFHLSCLNCSACNYSSMGWSYLKSCLEYSFSTGLSLTNFPNCSFLKEKMNFPNYSFSKVLMNFLKQSFSMVYFHSCGSMNQNLLMVSGRSISYSVGYFLPGCYFLSSARYTWSAH